jgi:tetratricopeptide (TPR) repeat protein
LPWWRKDSPEEEAQKLNDFNWYYSEGQRLFGANLMDAAIEYFDKALNIKNTAELWNYEGTAYLVKGKRLDAVRCFNNALDIDPRFSPAIHNKAETIKNLTFWERQCYYKP